MFCSSCGRQLIGSEAFCPSCGKKIRQEQPIALTAVAKPQPAPIPAPTQAAQTAPTPAAVVTQPSPYPLPPSPSATPMPIQATASGAGLRGFPKGWMIFVIITYAAVIASNLTYMSNSLYARILLPPLLCVCVMIIGAVMVLKGKAYGLWIMIGFSIILMFFNGTGYGGVTLITGGGIVIWVLTWIITRKQIHYFGKMGRQVSTSGRGYASHAKFDNYIKEQIKRISRNRTILFLILAAYFSIFIFVGAMNQNARDGDAGFRVFIILIGCLPTALFLFYAIQSVRSRGDYTKSKTYRRLSGIAQAPPEIAAADINRDMGTADRISKGLLIGERWIFIQGAFSLHVYPSTWFIWAYMLINKNSLITSYSTVMAFSNGKRVTLAQPGSQACENLLGMLFDRYPHIVLGYNRTWLRMFKNNLDEFIRIVNSSA